MILLNDYKDINVWIRYFFQKMFPPVFYPYLLKFFYKRYMNKELSLSNPRTLSEKINVLKLANNEPLKFLLADRLYCKNYVKKIIPELSCAQVYQVAPSFGKIDFSVLPDSFIIKLSHACKTGILVENKNLLTQEQINQYRKYYKKVMSINYAFWGVLELQYKNIKPCIYVEEYIPHVGCEKFMEYEIYCFNGNPEFIQYTINNNNSFDVTFLDTEWKKAPYDLFAPRQETFIPSTPNKDKMIEYARKLSKDFKFVRIDFFEKNDILYFAEMTFSPFMGNIKFVPDEYDLILGEKLKI